MFHRVKSEVQDAEQDAPNESEKTYRRDDERATSTQQSQSEEQVREQERPRSYTPRTNAPAENVQGKYAREESASTSEATPSPASSGYQPSVTRSAGYSGASSYAANPTSSSYTAPSSDAPAYNPNGAADRTLTIGRGINMSGEIDACDHLMVEGTVEAALKGAKLLEIADSGTFYGTVEIEEATIAGRFEGDITVNGRLTIKSSGVITGSIAYRELEVEAGAMLDGRMTPLKGTVDPKSNDLYRAGSEASAMAKPKATSGKKDNREPANTENGLFSPARAQY